jgi:hypothetical protein
MSKLQKYPLFELSPEQFEKLCIELVAASLEGDNAVLSEKPNWIDAVIGSQSPSGAKTVAVEVSHRTQFPPMGLNNFFERLLKEPRKFDEYVFITSSPLRQVHRQVLESATAKSLARPIRLLGQAEVVGLLDKHQDIAAKYFKTLSNRVRIRRLSEFTSILGVAISLFAFATSFYADRETPKEASAFSSQIASVEDSLTRLKSLEAGLQDLKSDLRSKSEESARVSKEYEEAMKLKALTKEQLEQVRLAIGSQSQWEVFLNYFFGFVLGVAGSVLATIITDRWKQRRVLTRPYA